MRDRRSYVLPVLGALTLVLLVSMLSPTSASAIDIPNPLNSIPSLDPADWAVSGFKGIIQFIFGKSIDDLARSLVGLLLAVPLLTDHAAFPKLNQYHSYVTGGAWGLLGLSFVWSSMRYWLAGMTGAGGYEALIGFGRTVSAIAMLLVFIPAFDGVSRAINALTHALIAGSEINTTAATHGIAAVLSIDNVTNGGIAMLVTMVSIVMAVVLLVVKAIVTSLLAVLFVASPLAIALYPVEELSFLLRSLLQAIFALMIFPVIWALCFATLQLLPSDALFPSATGDVINTIVSPLTVLASLIIAFRLPFKVLEIAGMQGSMSPRINRGMRHVQTARQLVAR